MRYARADDGVSIAYQAAGAGPAVVVMPSMPFETLQLSTDVAASRAFHAQLERRLRVVRYDARGTGLSQREVADVSPAAMQRDLQAVVDAAGFDRFGVMGTFGSSLHALAYAAASERVQRVALWGARLGGADSEKAPQTRALFSLIEQDWELFTETAARAWMGWSSGEAGERVAAGFREAVSAEVASAMLLASAELDVRPQLGEVAAPTLVLHRREAPQLSMEVAREVVAGVRDGRLVVLEGESPSMFSGDQEPLVRTLLEFFGAKESRAMAAAGAASPGAGSAEALSAREVEVMQLVARGLSNQEIAEALVVSVGTVKTHINNIFGKLSVRNRTQAVARARELALLE